MADIFISYSNNDQEQVREIASRLEQLGWSVWWDSFLISGQGFSFTIEDQLIKSRCVVVIWLINSVRSEWVNNEARKGQQLKKLIPIRIDDCNLPVEFNGLHTSDLTKWLNGSKEKHFNRLVNNLNRVLGPTPKSKIDSETSRKKSLSANESRHRPTFLPAIFFLLALLLFNPIKNWLAARSQDDAILESSRTREANKFLSEGNATGQIHQYWLSYVYAIPRSSEETQAYDALNRLAPAEVLPYLQEDLKDDKDYFWKKPHKVEWPPFKEIYDLCGTHTGIDWSNNFVSNFANDFARGFRTGKSSGKYLNELIQEQREKEKKKAEVCGQLEGIH